MKKKTFSIIAYVFAIVLVVGIIVCAVVPASTYPEIQKPTDDIMIYYDNTSSPLVYGTNDANFNKVLKEVKKGFKVNFLQGLFNGYLKAGDKDQVSISTKPNNVYITFNYLEAQTLKINGKDATKSINSSEKIKYDTLSFEVSKEGGSLVSVYFTTVDAEPSKYCVKYYANLSNVYDLIEEIKP